MFRFYYFILFYYYYFDLCLSFRLYIVPYLICICILNVIWQLNALNGFRFQVIYAISAITFEIFLKRKRMNCSF